MLIIFDCDGVLVDSELIASRELAAYLSNLGRPTTAQECRDTFTGLSLQSVAARIHKDWGLKLPEDFLTQLRARDAHAFERDLEMIPGVGAVLDALDLGRVRYCVASSGSPEKIHHSLTITKLLDRFDGRLFSATQVDSGKPAPDLFLFAAARLGVEPHTCVVIEDSPAGVAGAKAAGMRVLGFTGGSHCGPGYANKLRQADAVCTDMPSVLQALNL